MDHSNVQPTFDELLLQFHRPIYKYCYHMLRHEQDAEDATQDVFIKAFQSMERAEPILSTSAWLYKIAHNHCLNLLRRRKLISFIPFIFEKSKHPTQVDSTYAVIETRLAIDKMLSLLTPLDRSILLLRILEDKSFEEISEIITANSSFVRNRFERAKNKIKKNCTYMEGVLDNERTNIPIF